MNYDFPSAQFLYIAASASPFSNRVELNGVPFEDPYRNVPGGDTHPLPRRSAIRRSVPRLRRVRRHRSTHQLDARAVVERHLRAADWQRVAGVGRAISEATRTGMWGQAHINPATFMGLGPCTIAGVSYPSCTVSANTDRRRTLFLENPDAGQWLGPNRPVRRRRHAELPRSETVVRPSCRQRPQSRGQLHAVALRRRYRRQRRFQPVHRWIHETGRSVVR